MARKRKGDICPDTALKDQQTLQAALANPGKTRQQLGEEFGIDRQTVGIRIKRALGSKWAEDIIETSRRRNIEMLSKCDRNLNRILDDTRIENNGNQLKAMGSMYRTFGVWADQPLVEVNMFIPIKVTVEKEVHTIDVRSEGDQSSSEAGESIQE